MQLYQLVHGSYLCKKICFKYFCFCLILKIFILFKLEISIKLVLIYPSNFIQNQSHFPSISVVSSCLVVELSTFPIISDFSLFVMVVPTGCDSKTSYWQLLLSFYLYMLCGIMADLDNFLVSIVSSVKIIYATETHEISVKTIVQVIKHGINHSLYLSYCIFFRIPSSPPKLYTKRLSKKKPGVLVYKGFEQELRKKKKYFNGVNCFEIFVKWAVTRLKRLSIRSTLKHIPFAKKIIYETPCPVASIKRLSPSTGFLDL